MHHADAVWPTVIHMLLQKWILKTHNTNNKKICKFFIWQEAKKKTKSKVSKHKIISAVIIKMGGNQTIKIYY